jgi:tetratricopeptide (TPR) repeat protein
MDEERMKALKSEFHEEYPEFISFLVSHGKNIVTGILLAALVYLGVKFYFEREDGTVSQAATAFAQAKNIDDLERIILDYKSTPTAALATMSLAKAYFDAGDYDMALGAYMEFQTKFPDHPLVISADLNRISCLESRGQIQEALSSYDVFIAANPDHFLAIEAMFGRARCLEKLGLFNKARTVYEDYMVANPRGVWFPRAEESLQEVDRRLKAAAAPAAK